MRERSVPQLYGAYCLGVFFFLFGVKATSFPGSEVDIQTKLDKSRSMQSIRNSILRKLGRPLEPVPSMSPEPLNVTLPATKQETETGFISEIEEIISFSEPVDNLPNDNIFKFSLTRDNRTHDIQSASVLVQVKFKKRRKNKNKKKKGKVKSQRIKLILSTVDDGGRIIQQISKKKARISRTNWFKLFLPKYLIQKALLSDNASIKLHIRCRGCKRFAKLVLLHGTKRKRKRTKTNKSKRKRQRMRSRTLGKKRKLSRTRPFLLIHTKVKFRSRRETYRCEQTNQCCKLPLVFSFAEAGWSDWVISPPSFKTNVCSGGCNSGTDWTRGYNYTYHCADRKHKPLRIMYFDKTGAVIINELPKMIVTECGCSWQGNF